MLLCWIRRTAERTPARAAPKASPRAIEVLQFATATKKALEAQGFQVILTREGNDNPASFDDRSARANAQRGAVFITLHIASTGLTGTARVYVGCRKCRRSNQYHRPDSLGPSTSPFSELVSQTRRPGAAGIVEAAFTKDPPTRCRLRRSASSATQPHRPSLSKFPASL